MSNYVMIRELIDNEFLSKLNFRIYRRYNGKIRTIINKTESHKLDITLNLSDEFDNTKETEITKILLYNLESYGINISLYIGINNDREYEHVYGNTLFMITNDVKTLEFKNLVKEVAKEYEEYIFNKLRERFIDNGNNIQ